MIGIYKGNSSKELGEPQKQNCDTNYRIWTFEKESKNRSEMEENSTPTAPQYILTPKRIHTKWGQNVTYPRIFTKQLYKPIKTVSRKQNPTMHSFLKIEHEDSTKFRCIIAFITSDVPKL